MDFKALSILIDPIMVWEAMLTVQKLQCLYENFMANNIYNYMKLLDSDWLRAVHFKCNTSKKSVTPVPKV